MMKELVKFIKLRAVVGTILALIPPILFWYLPDLWGLYNSSPEIGYRISLSIIGGLISVLTGLIYTKSIEQRRQSNIISRYESKMKLSLLENILDELENQNDERDQFIAEIIQPRAVHFFNLYKDFVDKREIIEETDYLVTKVAETMLNNSFSTLIVDQDIYRWSGDFEGDTFKEDSLSKDVAENAIARGKSGDLELKRIFVVRKVDIYDPDVQIMLRAIDKYCLENIVEMKVFVVDDHPHLKSLAKNIKDFVLFSLPFGEILFKEDIYFDQKIPSKDTTALVTYNDEVISEVKEDFKKIYSQSISVEECLKDIQST